MTSPLPTLTRRASLAGLLAIAGCAPTAIVFDRSNLAHVKRIALLTPGFPEQPTVAVLPPTAGALFLVINGIQEGNRSREFAGFIASAGVKPEADFSNALATSLRDAGLQTSTVPADVRRTALQKEYGAISSPDIDAILDVVVTRYGFYAVTNAAPFKPSFVMQARLVDARTHIVLMQDRLDLVNIVPVDPKLAALSFPDYPDIAAKPAGAVQVLQSATIAAANAICLRLA